jgi:hypothetical protein
VSRAFSSAMRMRWLKRDRVDLVREHEPERPPWRKVGRDDETPSSPPNPIAKPRGRSAALGVDLSSLPYVPDAKTRPAA